MKGLIKKKLEPCAWLLSADEQAFEVEPLVIQVVPDIRALWYIVQEGIFMEKYGRSQMACSLFASARTVLEKEKFLWQTRRRSYPRLEGKTVK